MANKSEYIKSPLNYIGGKYKLLPQILPLFPKEQRTMVDLFAGGCDVCANIKAERIVANDINYHLIEIFRSFQALSTEDILSRIEGIISTWHLTKSDKEAYLSLRSHYNESHDPMELFVLVCYSFNYQLRFNSAQQYNNPFGKNRSSFNPTLRDNLIRFRSAIDNIEFSMCNFKDLDLSFLEEGDFLYADPPYLITTGSYNDGKRGFEGWSEAEERALYSLLDSLDVRGVKFALSNVIEHKGRKNAILNTWREKYITHEIISNYSNSNYHGKNTEALTTEVLITNY